MFLHNLDISWLKMFLLPMHFLEYNLFCDTWLFFCGWSCWPWTWQSYYIALETMRIWEYWTGQINKYAISAPHWPINLIYLQVDCIVHKCGTHAISLIIFLWSGTGTHGCVGKEAIFFFLMQAKNIYFACMPNSFLSSFMRIIFNLPKLVSLSTDASYFNTSFLQIISLHSKASFWKYEVLVMASSSFNLTILWSVSIINCFLVSLF